MYTKIIGTGSHLPGTSADKRRFGKWWDTSDEWIVTRTGIRERHIAAPNETVSTMGFEAATRAIEMAGIEKEQIGPDYRCDPPPARAFRVHAESRCAGR